MATVKQQKKSATLAEKMKRPTVKAMLCQPYTTTSKWPNVPSDDVSFVVHELRRVFSSVDLRKSSDIHIDHRKKTRLDDHFNKLTTLQRKEQVQKFEEQRPEAEMNLRSQLYLGFRKSMRALERDELRLLLVSRESHRLTWHLCPLAATRTCPGMALPGLETELCSLLSVTKLSTIGFRKTTKVDSPGFDDLVTAIASKCPSITLPWLKTEKPIQTPLNTMDTVSTKPCDKSTQDRLGTADGESPTQHVASSSSSTSQDLQDSSTASVSHTDNYASEHRSDSTAKPEEKDYSYLYVYRTESKRRPPIKFIEENVRKVDVKRTGMENADFIAFGDEQEQEEDKLEEGRKRKKLRSGKKKNTGKRRKESPWQDMILGKVQQNRTRKDGKLS